MVQLELEYYETETILKENEYYILVDTRTNLQTIVQYYRDYKSNFIGFGYTTVRGIDFTPKFDLHKDIEIYELDYKRGNKVSKH